MATTTVLGTIGRTFYDGKGAEIVETFTARGEQITKRWSAFFESPHGLTEGQQVEVSGMHGDKVDEWEKDGETRRSVKRTLNRAAVKGAPAQPASVADVWNAPNHAQDEIPF